MPTEIDFVKHQDRSFFNIHKPVRLSWDDFYNQYNQRRNPLPESDELRQTGSGRGSAQRGAPFQPKQVNKAMRNNFDPSVKAPVDRIYPGTISQQFHAPVVNKLKYPLQSGGGMHKDHRHHGYRNPAVNNWKPGTRIAEPLRVYEYSTASQVHAKPQYPVHQQKSQRPLILGHNSYDDGKSLKSTDRYVGTNRQGPQHNPLVVKY